MTVTAPEFTPHASSPEALAAARTVLESAQEALKQVDLRSLKGTVREDVKAARDAVASALKTSRR